MEMRRRNNHMNLYWLRCICITLLFAIFSNIHAIAQKTKYKVKNGKMYIEVNKNVPANELEQFVHQYDLNNLELKQFIEKGFKDSINSLGWKVEFNTSVIVILSKPLGAYNDMEDPVKRILFAASTFPGYTMFPPVSNNWIIGYNRFKNKYAFRIKDSVVIFYLRNNLKANRVMLAGSFNNWQPDVLAMTKTDSGWTAAVKLKPGKYWYKFVIDGDWNTDSDNLLNENDGEGNTNSVFYYTNKVFNLEGYTKTKRVFIAGSFNDWQERNLPMQKTATGWFLPVYLADGTHTYRFIADGNWLEDPSNPKHFPNEFGEFNSVLTIGKPYLFKLDGYTNARIVILTGSFNKWRNDELYMHKTEKGWELPYVINAGNYEYKFIVDGKDIADPLNPPPLINVKGAPSILILEPNYTFHLKGFEKAKTIFLAGDFNDWNPSSLPMKRVNDEWVFTVHLSPGKHLYKLVVDGNWIIDPGNKLWEQNEHETGNSVLWIEK